MHRITIYDVAREVGCSAATVSLVLQNSNKIKLSTRQKVLQVVDQLGYIPNYTARSLSKQSTHTLGLIVPNLENPIFSQMISGVEEYANSKGYNLLLGVSNMDMQKEFLYLDMLRQKQVDGLLIFPTFLNEILQKLHGKPERNVLPIVFCGSSGEHSSEISFVKCDNRMGAYIATEHLIQIGRKRIGFVCASVDAQQSASRIAGYRDALSFYGIECSDKLIRYCPQTEEEIFKTTIQIIQEEKVDAIFYLYDYIAIAAIRAIQSIGLRIPQDVAIMGYDNIHISRYLPTTLSTIDTHSHRVGYMAAEMLTDKIEHPDTPSRKILLKPSLVIGESTVADC